MTRTSKGILAMVLGIGFAGGATAMAQDVIDVQPKDFVSTYLIDDQTVAEIRKSNNVRGFGEATYAFETAAPGWWEFWAEGSESPFDFILDGQTLIHSPIQSGVWEPMGKLEKMLNLHIPAGKHTLCLSRPEPWGIPWITKMRFSRAKDITGMVRVVPVSDCLALRQDAPLPLRITAGKGPVAQQITVAVQSASGLSADWSWSKTVEIPAGDGNFATELALPTTAEGVFDAVFADAQGRPVDRTIQYLVVAVKKAPAMNQEPKRELIQEIDCAKQTPDYSSAETKVVESPLGAYRESGDKGRVGFNMNADWFAYRLQLPSIQEPYLIEVEDPDDDERTGLISFVERCPNPYAPTLGYASGGVYSLSNTMLTHQLYVYPREKDPRLLLQTWRTGMKMAAAKIRVYRLSSLPPALKLDPKGRSFGGYQEENIRFTSYYGSTPDGDGWANFDKAAQRFGAHSRFIGANLWQQTIGNYQATLWPCKTIKGYGSESEGSWCVTGPLSRKDPFKKDIVRLQLLTCEKYGIDYLGEQHLPPNRAFQLHMDKEFGGKGTLEDNGPQKPWLAVSKTGECAVPSVSKPYWNVFYPGVQDWSASVMTEVADRYKDSPAFKGVVVRLMSWVFSAWQTVPSIAWGYEDFTIALFQKETGVNVPVAVDAPDRFAKRHAWLMANAYDKWVNWRCAKVYAYHCRLAKILTDARPDLKLFISAYGPDFTASYTEAEFQEKGWDGLIKESGIDLALYNKNPAMSVQAVIVYPSSAVRGGKTPLEMAFGRETNWNTRQTVVTAHEAKGGTVCAVHLDADSFEGEMVEGTAIGYDPSFKVRNNTTIHGAGVVTPAGIHFLERFAEAMASGNMTVISDGSHGYDQQQPQYMRAFLAEYRPLPPIGMQPVEAGADPVAVWQGAGDDNSMYFYIVNRLDQPVTAELRFAGAAAPVRLATKEQLKLDGDVLKLTLKPYELLSFAGGPADTRITAVKAVVPEGVRAALRTQIAFSESLTAGERAEPILLNLSPVALKQAKQRIGEAKDALEKGRVCTARRLLLGFDVTKLYEAFHAYPPGLIFKKAPAAPPGAMLPPALRDATIPASRPTQVCDAARLVPSLTGVSALRWDGAAVEIAVQQQFSDRYRLELAYVSANGFATPSLYVDGAEIPLTSLVLEDGGAWSRAVTAEPIMLTAGAHKLKLAKAPGKDAAVLYLRLEPVPRDLLANQWLTIGPFKGSDDPRVKGSLAGMMNSKYPPEMARDFAAKCEGLNGKTLAWQRPTFDADYVDFYKQTGEYCFKIGYAVCRLDSPKERDAQLRFGVDYWAKIWLNGEEVFTNVDAHNQPPHKNEYAIPVRLAAGRNEILVKLHAGMQGNGFWLNISDPGDLKVVTPEK